VHFVRGRVEDTIPGTVPERIALLRLDTDWYASTRHELIHLYPRLVPGGILIIDDYGHWQGARKATDEFLAGLPTPVFLQRLDYTGRLAVKPSPGSSLGNGHPGDEASSRCPAGGPQPAEGGRCDCPAGGRGLS
jgi:hypothetical protein